MPIYTLKDRITEYEQAYEFKFTKKLPILIKLNGRGFSKTTSLLTKPFSEEYLNTMSTVIMKLAHDLEGVCFIYSFNDQIFIIIRNDQNVETEAWYDNKIQKIVSASAAIATINFNKAALMFDLELVGDAIFTAEAFALPNINETINALVCYQQKAYQDSVHLACFHELIKNFSLEKAKDMLISQSSTEDKIDLLNEKCNIDYFEYDSAYRRGIGCYRTLKVIKINNEEILKNKWTLDKDLPIFSKNQEFMSNILRGGTDIFRNEKF